MFSSFPLSFPFPSLLLLLLFSPITVHAISQLRVCWRSSGPLFETVSPALGWSSAVRHNQTIRQMRPELMIRLEGGHSGHGQKMPRKTSFFLLPLSPSALFSRPFVRGAASSTTWLRHSAASAEKGQDQRREFPEPQPSFRVYAPASPASPILVRYSCLVTSFASNQVQPGPTLFQPPIPSGPALAEL